MTVIQRDGLTAAVTNLHLLLKSEAVPAGGTIDCIIHCETSGPIKQLLSPH